MRNSILIALTLPLILLSNQKTQIQAKEEETPFEPWMTGPLLSPTPVNMKPGHPAVEPYIIISNTYGEYNSSWKLINEPNVWGINLLLDYQMAFTENTGIEIFASGITNFQNEKQYSHLNDTFVYLGYQVSNDKKGSWVPDCRLIFQTIFPTGNYDKLGSKSDDLGVTGQGAYFFGPTLACQKLFYLPQNFFMLHWALGYYFPTTAKVKGYNAYGGGIGTKGKITPGQFLTAFLAGEYSFNQKWVFAMDIFLTYQLETSKFRGNPGLNPDGTPATVGLSSITQISLTPSLEYNLSANSGFLFGSWFTVAGQNAEAFASAFLAFVYVF